jgi:aminopeptidase N
VRFRAAGPGRSSSSTASGQGDDRGRWGRREGNRLALRDLAASNVLRVRARCATAARARGLHRFVDPADGEPTCTRRASSTTRSGCSPASTSPTSRRSSARRRRADGWTVVANARGSRVGDGGRSRRPSATATYLFTVAAGPWHACAAASTTGASSSGCCRRSLAEHLDADADELFEVTAQCFDLQQELFGRRYPFGDTYDQLFVPEFNAGRHGEPRAP